MSYDKICPYYKYFLALSVDESQKFNNLFLCENRISNSRPLTSKYYMKYIILKPIINPLNYIYF